MVKGGRIYYPLIWMQWHRHARTSGAQMQDFPVVLRAVGDEEVVHYLHKYLSAPLYIVTAAESLMLARGARSSRL